MMLRAIQLSVTTSLLLLGCGDHDHQQVEAIPNGGESSMDVPVPTPPLRAGDSLPELECAGWINGSPLPLADQDAKLFVVDVWANW